jgi:hypothetical protein
MAIGLAVGLLLLAGVITAWNGSRGPSNQQYYYNVQTGELVGRQTTEVPPIKLTSGQLGVLAHVYACGDCASNETFIGFLTKYSDDDKRAMSTELTEQQVQQGPMTVPTPLAARAPEQVGGEIQWFPMQSPQGMAIADAANQRCGGTNTTKCVP